jgi:methylaspartate mutase epsilon subunit
LGVPDTSAIAGDFEHQRQRVLGSSPGKAPDPETAAEFLVTQPDSTFASVVLADNGSRTLIQPRGGFARFEDQHSLGHALSEAGADFIPLTIDSHTRSNDYETAQVLLDRSELEEKNLLNGYPLIAHGYQASRHLYSKLEKPVSLRHGTPDARYLVEVALASGVSEIEGGALCYTLPYSRTFPVAKALVHWQYVDRLVALLSTPERPIHRESFGVLSATMVPPAMVIVVELCELLLAAEQGVKSFAVSFAQSGSLVQDCATAQVLRQLAKEYLHRFGFEDMRIPLVYHQWMGAFPYDHIHANALIVMSTQIASVIGADKIVSKTKDEARGIPDVASNTEAVELVRYTLDHCSSLDTTASPPVQTEANRITRESRVIMEAIFALPQQAFWNSVATAVHHGIIDIPFAPHETNANRLVTRRGRNDGIYIENPGSVPVSKLDLAEEHTALSEGRRNPANGLFQSMVGEINLMISGRQ